MSFVYDVFYNRYYTPPTITPRPNASNARSFLTPSSYIAVYVGEEIKEENFS